MTAGTVAVVEPVSLRILIRQKLADGRLPHDSIPKVWGGPSNGQICDACNTMVAKNQFVMEGVSTDFRKRPLQFHVGCFYLWDAERAAPGARAHTFTDAGRGAAEADGAAPVRVGRVGRVTTRSMDAPRMRGKRSRR